MKLKKRKVTKLIGFLFLIILSAYCSFSIPVTQTGIPFTLQSLVIFILAAFMHPFMSLIVLIGYLILGLLGFPVFAEGSSGWSSLSGGSGGFLYGFVFAGIYISRSFLNKTRLTFIRVLIIFFLATIILFGFGVLHLTIIYDIGKAISYGLLPFWKIGLIKALIASIFVFILIKNDICKKKISPD